MLLDIFIKESSMKSKNSMKNSYTIQWLTPPNKQKELLLNQVKKVKRRNLAF